jgi:predicted Zn-dependent peptidase
MKSGYVDNAYMLYDDARELNFTFAYDNHVMDLGYASIDERRAAYESITPEDVRRAAEIIFTSDNLTLTLKGDKKKTDTEALAKIVSRL